MICPSIAKVVEMIFSIDHVTKHIKSYYFIIVLSTTQYFLIYPASPTSRIILTNTPDWKTPWKHSWTESRINNWNSESIRLMFHYVSVEPQDLLLSCNIHHSQSSAFSGHETVSVTHHEGDCSYPGEWWLSGWCVDILVSGWTVW